MSFELVIFTLWVICLISYCILSWTTIVEIRLSSSGDSVFEGSNGSFDLRKIPSCEGDDIATFLCRQGYELGSKLGEGAYAVVREAYSNRHGRYNSILLKIHDLSVHSTFFVFTIILPSALGVHVQLQANEKKKPATRPSF